MNFKVTKIRRGIAVLLLAAIAGWLVSPAAAQKFPSGPVHIIVPFAAGGLTDALARVLGNQVADAIGQPVIVENRSGAGSIVGMEDTVYLHPHREEKIQTSAQAVRKVVAIANELGREIATPAEARAIMGIDLAAKKSGPTKHATRPAAHHAPAPTS